LRDHRGHALCTIDHRSSIIELASSSPTLNLQRRLDRSLAVSSVTFRMELVLSILGTGVLGAVGAMYVYTHHTGTKNLLFFVFTLSFILFYLKEQQMLILGMAPLMSSLGDSTLSMRKILIPVRKQGLYPMLRLIITPRASGFRELAFASQFQVHSDRNF
jgi:hypothetical protein